MGVVDFDPEKWSQANACDGPGDVAKVAKDAKVGSTFPELSQLSQLSQLASLDEPLLIGVAKLRVMRAPRTVRADCWPRVVRDAIGMAETGWAVKALALSWSPLNLFGAVTDATGDPSDDGLAVWLGGRKLLAICDTFAVAEDETGRAYLNRRDQVGAMLLWELDR